MEIGISIIVPCYNCEKTIVKTLESINSNFYENYEIILVEDCSKDNTFDVISKYIKDNNNNIILYKNHINLGAGESRNIGISRATKDYITFVDSDDIVTRDFLSNISKIAQQYSADCIIFDAAIKNVGKQYNFNMFYGGKFTEGLVDKSKTIVYAKGVPWGKAYKKDLIKKNNIRFANLIRSEDIVFTKIALSYTNKIYYLSKVLYYYCENEASLMHNNNLLDKNNALLAYDMIERELEKRGFEEELRSIFLIDVLYSTTLTTIRQHGNVKGNYHLLKKKYHKKFVNSFIKDKYFSLYDFKYKLILYLIGMRIFYFWEVVLKIVVNKK